MARLPPKVCCAIAGAIFTEASLRIRIFSGVYVARRGLRSVVREQIAIRDARDLREGRVERGQAYPPDRQDVLELAALVGERLASAARTASRPTISS